VSIAGVSVIANSVQIQAQNTGVSLKIRIGREDCPVWRPGNRANQHIGHRDSQAMTPALIASSGRILIVKGIDPFVRKGPQDFFKVFQTGPDSLFRKQFLAYQPDHSCPAFMD
jgi:hypothetical protein